MRVFVDSGLLKRHGYLAEDDETEYSYDLNTVNENYYLIRELCDMHGIRPHTQTIYFLTHCPFFNKDYVNKLAINDEEKLKEIKNLVQLFDCFKANKGDGSTPYYQDLMNKIDIEFKSKIGKPAKPIKITSLKLFESLLHVFKERFDHIKKHKNSCMVTDYLLNRDFELNQIDKFSFYDRSIYRTAFRLYHILKEFKCKDPLGFIVIIFEHLHLKELTTDQLKHAFKTIRSDFSK